MKNRFVLWGVGEHSKNLLGEYLVPIESIEGIIDSNSSLQGKMFLNKKIYAPNTLKDFKSKVVVIGTDRYYDEVVKQIDALQTGKRTMLIDDYIAFYPRIGEDTTASRYEKLQMTEEAERMVKMIESHGEIPRECLEDAKVLASRNDAVMRMPKGLVVGEVGVAYGDFSQFLIDEMQPSHFYAIDFFNKDNPYISFWGRNDFAQSGMTHEEWYRNRFKDLINSNKMTVCSGMSWDCLGDFQDDFFDYLYIDACHDYESTKKDIEVAIKKVKKGGIIQFNDYTILDIVGGTYYGVVPAVNDMIRTTHSQVLYYCLNPLGYCDVVVRLNK